MMGLVQLLARLRTDPKKLIQEIRTLEENRTNLQNDITALKSALASCKEANIVLDETARRKFSETSDYLIDCVTRAAQKPPEFARQLRVTGPRWLYVRTDEDIPNKLRPINQAARECSDDGSIEATLQKCKKDDPNFPDIDYAGDLYSSPNDTYLTIVRDEDMNLVVRSFGTNELVSCYEVIQRTVGKKSMFSALMGAREGVMKPVDVTLDTKKDLENLFNNARALVHPSQSDCSKAQQKFIRACEADQHMYAGAALDNIDESLDILVFALHYLHQSGLRFGISLANQADVDAIMTRAPYLKKSNVMICA